MRKIIVLLLAASVAFTGCKKEKSGTTTPPEDRVQVNFEIDGEPVEAEYKDEPNKCSMYSFGGYSGNYFGISSLFELSSKGNLEVTFGTFKTENTILTEKEFAAIIATGPREYGSLGSFDSYPQIAPGKVEMAFVDAKSNRWCTSSLKQRPTPNGIKTEVEVKQPGSKFSIDEMEAVTTSHGPGYRVKASFDCFLYEVNGKHKKKMKGSFVGVIIR